jgi:hypothetical protein
MGKLSTAAVVMIALAACSVDPVTFTPGGDPPAEDCATPGDEDGNGAAIGLGINGRGAGYRCGSTECSAGNVDAGGVGLLWGR